MGTTATRAPTRCRGTRTPVARIGWLARGADMTGCVGSVASPPELASAEGKAPVPGVGKAPSGKGPPAAVPAGAASAGRAGCCGGAAPRDSRRGRWGPGPPRLLTLASSGCCAARWAKGFNPFSATRCGNSMPALHGQRPAAEPPCATRAERDKRRQAGLGAAPENPRSGDVLRRSGAPCSIALELAHVAMCCQSVT